MTEIESQITRLEGIINKANQMMRRINQDVREFCARDPRTPAATLKSWEEAGWKSSSAGQLNTSQNPSEAEAMGPDLDEEEVLNTAVNEGEDFQPAVSSANLSLVSGIELLAVSREGEEDTPEMSSTLEEGSGQGALAAPPQVSAAMGTIIMKYIMRVHVTCLTFPE